MATNKHIDILIIKELLDDLTAIEKGELTAWLNESPVHLNKREKLRKTLLNDQLIHGWNAIDTNQNWVQILEKVNQPQRKQFNFLPYMRYAAAAVLLIFAGVWLLHLQSPTTIVNDSNLPLAYVLPDSSSVWLKQNAVVTFKKNGFIENRAISMDGEVYFEVKSGEVPFIVLSNETYIRVLGTSFNIQEQEHKTEVMLLEGAVKFSAGQTFEVLAPGELAVFDGVEIQKSEDIDMNRIGWKTGVFIFSKQPLHSVLQQISEYYGITYNLKPDKENLLITTTLNKLALHEVIGELSYILDIKIELQDQHLNIY